MNKDEYNILIDIAKQCGKDNPKKLIDDRINDKKIQYNDSGNVVSIDLHSNQLSGPIPSSIGGLPQLKELILYNNQLNGPIPSPIGDLSQLKELHLSNNQLSGPIPSSIGGLSQLDKLHLNNNQLSGPIPSSIGGLSQLKYLDFDNNQLSGPIPSSMGGLSQLKELYLNNNQLSGPIPSSIGGLSQLDKLHLNNNQLSGPIPSSIGGLSQLKELYLNNNQLSGTIPSSIGGLSQLKTLDLDNNQLSGPIPASIGDLSQLKELYLSRNQLSGPTSSLGGLSQSKTLYLSSNKELSGALPSMVSKNCNINITGTSISRVEIKTKPLNNVLDYLFVVSHVVLGYVDLVFDILAIIALSSTDIPIMIANILFIVLNVALGVWMSRDDMMGILRTVLQLDQLYQGYMTLTAGYQTDEMIVSKKIDAVTRSMPSMVLQMYGLLRSLSHPDSSDNQFLDRFLSPTQTLLVSVASSIVGAGFTLASLAPNSGYSIFNKHFVIHYAYYTVEITNRVVILSIMFFSVDAYGFLPASLDFLFRLWISYYGLSKSNLRDATLLAVQSFGSDRIVLALLYIGYMMNTLEMFIFLVVLNTLHTPYLDTAGSQGADTCLTVVACITWLIRLVFYCSGVLDIVPEPMSTKEKPMAQKEEGTDKDDTRGHQGSVSSHRIDDSKDIEVA